MLPRSDNGAGARMIGKFAVACGAMAAAILAMPVVAHAEASPAPEALALAAKFGARQGIESASLSPDGNLLALLMPAGDGQKLLIYNFTTGGALRPILANPHPSEHITVCRWPTVTRLFCSIVVHSEDEGTLITFTRLIALDADGHNLAVVTPRVARNSMYFGSFGGGVIDWNGSRPGQVLLTREYVPELGTETRNAESREGLGVDSVDVTTLVHAVVESPRSTAVQYITDGLGHVRIVGVDKASNTGYATGVNTYLYRKAGDRGWNALSTVDGSDGSTIRGFVPVAVDPALDVAFGFDTTADGHKALYSIKLDGSNTRTLVLGRPDVDVDRVISIGRQHRVVGASYATDRRVAEYFDPALRRLGTALGKALPDSPQISFVDASADENRLLIVASSDTDPGVLYRLDRTDHKLERVLPFRPELDGVALAPMTPISFPARDGTMIPGYLTLPPKGPRTGLPALVMPHGGPSARDEWGFDWLVQFFAARGFAVLQPNFRGSSGYGADWFKHNGFQSWPLAIGDIDDAGRWLVAQKIADPAHLAVFGWSYGGYAALQSGVTEPGLFKAVVAVAPVTDLPLLREEERRYVAGALADREIGEGDQVVAGSPARNAARMAVPVLLFHGDQDLNVDIEQSREMANKLRRAGKPVDYVEFKGLDHQLDSTAARTTLLSRSDAFLRAALGL